jgi:hypothetical protein
MDQQSVRPGSASLDKGTPEALVQASAASSLRIAPAEAEGRVVHLQLFPHNVLRTCSLTRRTGTWTLTAPGQRPATMAGAMFAGIATVVLFSLGRGTGFGMSRGTITYPLLHRGVPDTAPLEGRAGSMVRILQPPTQQ